MMNEQTLSGSNLNQNIATSGYCQTIAPKWKFCPEDGQKFEEDWSHCPKCGRVRQGLFDHYSSNQFLQGYQGNLGSYGLR